MTTIVNQYCISYEITLTTFRQNIIYENASLSVVHICIYIYKSITNKNKHIYILYNYIYIYNYICHVDDALSYWCTTNSSSSLQPALIQRPPGFRKPSARWPLAHGSGQMPLPSLLFWYLFWGLSAPCATNTQLHA